METRSYLITKIKNLIEIIRRSSSVKLIPKSVFHSFQRIFTLKIFYSQNSRTRIASIFPSLQSKSPEITEKSFIAQGRRRRNREYTRNYNHPKNPAYLGGRSKEGRRDLPGFEQQFLDRPRERNNRWNRRRESSLGEGEGANDHHRLLLLLLHEVESRWESSCAKQRLITARLESRRCPSPPPLCSRSPATDARPAPFNREASNHADRTGGGRQSLLEADYDGHHDGDDSPWCSRVLVTCQCQSGITLVWIGMPVRRAVIFSPRAFSSMGK